MVIGWDSVVIHSKGSKQWYSKWVQGLLLPCSSCALLIISFSLVPRHATVAHRLSNAMINTCFNMYHTLRTVQRAYVITRPRAQSTPAHISTQSTRHPFYVVAIYFLVLCTADEPLRAG